MDLSTLIDRCSWEAAANEESRERKPIPRDKVLGCIFSSVLEPGEQPLAYADRALPEHLRRSYDAFSYPVPRRNREIDALAYEKRPANRETDALAYPRVGPRDEDEDALAYPHGPRTREEDALAYEAAPPSPETDAFMAEPEVRPDAPLDALLLTDRRLIRAIVDGDKVTLSSAPVELMGSVRIRVQTRWDDRLESVVIEKSPTYFALQLPRTLRVRKEGGWWIWRLREGLDPWHEFSLWRRGSR